VNWRNVVAVVIALALAGAALAYMFSLGNPRPRSPDPCDHVTDCGILSSRATRPSQLLI